MKRAYVYPYSGRNTSLIPNPYVDHFMEAAKPWFHIVNDQKPSYNGIFDLLKYLFRLDVVFLNWIEDLPDKKYGVLQSFVFLFSLMMMKVLSVQVVWTLHNKGTHGSIHPKMKSRLYGWIIRHADLIITHASEGREYLKQQIGKDDHKILFAHHPVICDSQGNNTTKAHPTIDLFIWGTLERYKKVDEFLRFAVEKGYNQKYSLYVHGKIRDPQYRDLLIEFNRYPNVEVQDGYIAFERLYEMMNRTRLTAFTYSHSSVLSSGALMDSLCGASVIIGPHKGAFADLQKEGLIFTFNRFQDIFSVLESLDPETLKVLDQKKRAFFKQNTWTGFAQKVYQSL